jgi:hypothetical protein
MPFTTNQPSPVRDALLQLLRQHGGDTGITTGEIAVRMGRTTESINGALCRMATYGYVRKLTKRNASAPAPPHELNRWSLPK